MIQMIVNAFNENMIVNTDKIEGYKYSDDLSIEEFDEFFKTIKSDSCLNDYNNHAVCCVSH